MYDFQHDTAAALLIDTRTGAAFRVQHRQDAEGSWWVAAATRDGRIFGFRGATLRALCAALRAYVDGLGSFVELWARASEHTRRVWTDLTTWAYLYSAAGWNVQYAPDGLECSAKGESPTKHYRGRIKLGKGGAPHMDGFPPSAYHLPHC